MVSEYNNVVGAVQDFGTEPSNDVDIHDVSAYKALDRMKTRFVTNVSHELRTPVTTINLNEMAEAVVVSHQVPAQEQGLTLGHRLAEPGALALVDPEQMMQVLNNLVENAIRYTSAGGTVVVSTRQQEAEERTWATVTVADTGMGIPVEELPHIFDRFFRGDEPQAMQLTGTGLGLAIVQEIVELHGGHVTVESEEGVGSTFSVWLPLTGQMGSGGE